MITISRATEAFVHFHEDFFHLMHGMTHAAQAFGLM